MILASFQLCHKRRHVGHLLGVLMAFSQGLTWLGDLVAGWSGTSHQASNVTFALREKAAGSVSLQRSSRVRWSLTPSPRAKTAATSVPGPLSLNGRAEA